VAIVDIDRRGLDAAAAALPDATAHVCDVSDPDAVSRLRGEVVERHGVVHLVVNNAGISVAGPACEVPLEEFQRAMNVNFWGPVHVCRAFAADLRASAARGEHAAICNVLSDFALFSLPTKAPYASSKHAARAFTEALAAELAGSGVSVSAAYPGATATGLLERGSAVDDEKRRREAEFLSKGLSPDDVAAAIVRGLELRKSRILIGRDTLAIDVATRLAPALVQAGVRRFWRRVPFL